MLILALNFELMIQITIQTFSGAIEYFSAAWAKAWVCGRSLAGTSVSNSSGDMDVSILRVLCVVR